MLGGSSRQQAQGAKLAASAAQPPGGAGPAFSFGASTAEPPRAQRDLFGSGRTLAGSSDSAGDSGAAANGVAAPSSPEPRQLPHFSFQSQPQPRAPARTPACRPVPHGSATKSAAAAAAAAARIPLPDDIRTPAAATAAAEARIALPADPRVSVNGLSSRFDDAVHVTDSAAHLHSRFASTVQMNGSGGAEERGANEDMARRFAGTQLRQSDGSGAVVQPGLRPAENARGARAIDPHAGAIGGGSGAAAASTAAESAAEQAPQSQASAPTVQQLPQRHQPEPQPIRSPGPTSQQPAAAQPAVAVDAMPPAHAERPMQPDAALAATEPLPPTKAPTAAAAAWQAQPEIAQQPMADSPAASRPEPRQRATHGSFIFSSSPAGKLCGLQHTAELSASEQNLEQVSSCISNMSRHVSLCMLTWSTASLCRRRSEAHLHSRRSGGHAHTAGTGDRPSAGAAASSKGSRLAGRNAGHNAGRLWAPGWRRSHAAGWLLPNGLLAMPAHDSCCEASRSGSATTAAVFDLAFGGFRRSWRRRLLGRQQRAAFAAASSASGADVADEPPKGIAPQAAGLGCCESSPSGDAAAAIVCGAGAAAAQPHSAAADGAGRRRTDTAEPKADGAGKSTSAGAVRVSRCCWYAHSAQHADGAAAARTAAAHQPAEVWLHVCSRVRERQQRRRRRQCRCPCIQLPAGSGAQGASTACPRGGSPAGWRAGSGTRHPPLRPALRCRSPASGRSRDRSRGRAVAAAAVFWPLCTASGFQWLRPWSTSASWVPCE